MHIHYPCSGHPATGPPLKPPKEKRLWLWRRHMVRIITICNTLGVEVGQRYARQIYAITLAMCSSIHCLYIMDINMI